MIKSLHQNKNMKKNGFSLSEVLITLVIIGVLAVMIIPNIKLATAKHENVVRLKKAISVVEQGLRRISLREGLPGGDYTFAQADESAAFLSSFSEVVHPIRVCKDGVTGCFSSDITYLNAQPANPEVSNSLITNDGFSYGWEKGYCEGKGLSEDDLDHCIGRFMIDINGLGKPNRYGYDVFFIMLIDRKGLIPAGKNSTYDCTRSNMGATCASKVIDEDGINYK